ncbi:MAG: cation diffusion facilitator family transporter [Nitrososphaeria archaeon]|nr:cation diffusion facilitator family transporter [Nitrososphaeria archaeon]
MMKYVGSVNGLVALKISFTLTLIFFFVELFGGLLFNSLALIGDAWHMLNDVFALFFALLASWVARRPLNERKTFGYYRSEVVAAFLNGVLLCAVVIFLFYEAYLRLMNPVHVEGFGMLVVSLLGFFANGLSAYVLHKSEGESLNVKGAFLHVIADMFGSIGAISAALIIYFTGWVLADSIISIFIGLLILYGSAKLIHESLNVLLEGVPSHINLKSVEEKILGEYGVESVHDLHVWCVTPDKMCILTAHVVVGDKVDQKRLLSKLLDGLKKDFGIDHVTIQFETKDFPKAANEH